MKYKLYIAQKPKEIKLGHSTGLLQFKMHWREVVFGEKSPDEYTYVVLSLFMK